MSLKWMAVLMAAMVLAAGWVYAEATEIPHTMEKVRGKDNVSTVIMCFALFGLMGGFAVLLIYRGIRAR